MSGVFRQQYRLKSGGVQFGPKVWIDLILEKKEKKYQEPDNKKNSNNNDNKNNSNNNNKKNPPSNPNNNVEPDLFATEVRAIQKSVSDLGLSLSDDEKSVDRILALIFLAKQKKVSDNDLTLFVINSLVETIKHKT